MSPRPIIASFADEEPVRRALGQLHAAGVERDDIALLMAEEAHTPRFGLVAGHKLAEGVTIGAALGAVLGGLVGGLYVIDDVTWPDSVALGFALAWLAGAGLGGGVGSILGGLAGSRAPEYKARLVDASTRAGRIMIAVWVSDDARAQRVTQILGEPKGGAEG
jgi:hypothetical protein